MMRVLEVIIPDGARSPIWRAPELAMGSSVASAAR